MVGHRQTSDPLSPISRTSVSVRCVAWTRVVSQTGTREGKVVTPFFTRGYEGFNIDDEDDWDRARTLIESGAVTLPDVERSRPYSPAE